MTASTQSDTPSSDAAAAAKTARKKRFEEHAKRFEENDSPQAPAPAPDQPFFVSPTLVTMLVGDESAFSGSTSRATTSPARRNGRFSNSYVAELAKDGRPVTIAKAHGTVTVQARVGLQEAPCDVTVVAGNKRRAGTPTWTVPKSSGYTPKKCSRQIRVQWQIVRNGTTSRPTPQAKR